MFPILDWRFPRSPPWISTRSGKPKYIADPFEAINKFNKQLTERKRPPRRKLGRGIMEATFGASTSKGLRRVPSLEELDHYAGPSAGPGAGRSGGGFKKDYEYQQSKEMDPMEYAWLIQKEFVSSIKYKKKMTASPKKNGSGNGYSMDSLNIGSNTMIKSSPSKISKNRKEMSSLKHLDLATGWASSRHVLVEEVISSVLERAQDSGDMSGLNELGLPARYLPIIAEAIQAEHFTKFQHLDLANSGSLGEKSLELRILVEKRLPAFLSCKILPYGYPM